MRVLIQRVAEASVHVDGRMHGRIGHGLVVLLGITHHDTAREARFLADKCVNLRIFEDDNGKFNRSALDVGGELLVVSQFTLYGDARKGRRPSFTEAAPPEVSEPLYEAFVASLKSHQLNVETGVFGAHMDVCLVNHGPVTILAEKDAT